jgi:hypothetical protein
MLAELRKLKKAESDYRNDVDEWYRSGDGRSPKWVVDHETGRSHNMGGKGYSFPYCPHGSSNWTDYDNICGGCEDGSSLYQRAIWSAQEKVAEYNKRIDWLVSAPDSLPDETRRALIDWALSPVRSEK